MVTRSRRPLGLGQDERGFTLIELLIAVFIMAAVMGAAVTLANNVRYVYQYELEDAAVQQEARFALDWIGAVLAAAGSNPYDIATSACPAAATTFTALQLDPDGDSINDDIRIHADVNPPDGLLVGVSAPTCNQQGEDVTIALDAVTRTLTRLDRGQDAGAVAVTDAVFTQVLFTYLDANRAVTTNPAAVAYVRVNLAAQSRARNPYTARFTTYVYQSEIRVRVR